MEGLGIDQLRYDHWQNVSKFLTPRDLCRLMCVSHSFWAMWGLDRFWSQQELRVCSRFPELKSVFEKYRAVKPLAKKARNLRLRKKRKGIWYVFKTVLYRAGTNEGIMEFGRRPDMHPLVYAVVLVSIPNNEKIVEKRITTGRVVSNRLNIVISTSSKEISFRIAPNMDLLFVDYIWDTRYKFFIQHNFNNGDYFLDMYVAWLSFLFEEPFSVLPLQEL